MAFLRSHHDAAALQLQLEKCLQCALVCWLYGILWRHISIPFFGDEILTRTHIHTHAGAHKSPATENHIISMHMCRTKSKTWRRPQATRHKHCVACFFLAFGGMWIIWHWTRYNALLLLACRQYVECVTGYAYVCVCNNVFINIILLFFCSFSRSPLANIQMSTYIWLL